MRRGDTFQMQAASIGILALAACLLAPSLAPVAQLCLNPIEARALVLLLQRHAVLVRPGLSIRQSRDPADDKFLDCAVVGSADYLVSVDADLLSLKEIQGIPIIDVPAFWQRLVEAQKMTPTQSCPRRSRDLPRTAPVDGRAWDKG